MARLLTGQKHPEDGEYDRFDCIVTEPTKEEQCSYRQKQQGHEQGINEQPAEASARAERRPLHAEGWEALSLLVYDPFSNSSA